MLKVKEREKLFVLQLTTKTDISIIIYRDHMLCVVVPIIIIVHMYVKIAVFAVRKMFNYKEIHQN